MANIIDIKFLAIAAALNIPQNDPRRQQIRVLKITAKQGSPSFANNIALMIFLSRLLQKVSRN
jgi:hypothetical protein